MRKTILCRLSRVKCRNNTCNFISLNFAQCSQERVDVFSLTRKIKITGNTKDMIYGDYIKRVYSRAATYHSRFTVNTQSGLARKISRKNRNSSTDYLHGRLPTSRRCGVQPRRAELGLVNSSQKLRLRCNSSRRERANQCGRSLRAISRLIRRRGPEEYGPAIHGNSEEPRSPASEISFRPLEISRFNFRLKIRREPLYWNDTLV